KGIKKENRMAQRTQRDHEADGWERSDYPITCESCLGDNPYLRMVLPLLLVFLSTIASLDKDCKICTRPFTVFRWQPGRNARYKKTEICQTCSKLKNVCQVCLLDLDFGLPVQVRDTALNIITTHDHSIPRSHVNREYFAGEHDRMNRDGLDYESSYGKTQPNDTLLKLQRREPFYKMNKPHVCTFYTSGRCTRGEECAYRHEMPITGELSHQNIKDRYYGENDPVAMKLLGKVGEMGTLEPPEDESIKTLYVGGVKSGILEQDIRGQFYAYGEIESIRILAEKACAFVTYTTRQGAEEATQQLSNRLVINGQSLKLKWGRPQVPKPDQDSWNQRGSRSGLLARAVIPQHQYYAHPPPPPNQDEAYYPSMDPQRMGSSTSENNGASSSSSSSSSYLMTPHEPYQQQYRF
ncbi:unnamed protein product, partial [Thlaspi arvense]